MNYRRVFLYYSLGLFLLRTISTEYTASEALLNYFKIVEIVIHKRAKEKPH